MAYNKDSRFPPPPTCYKLLEPGAYQHECSVIGKPNKAPFLSNTQRVTQFKNPVWTDAIYQAAIPQKIPNITSLLSKRPRFPYESLSKEDIEEILCRCGIENVCECKEDSEPEQTVICHAKVRRRLFKGHPPRSNVDEGLSSPSKRDHGFELQSDGTHKRLYEREEEQSPPFYNTEVKESTAFYRGCKWSEWKSSRAVKSLEERPGPADYTIEIKPTKDEICYEKLREYKRKTSKQLRYIESVQQRNILEGRPGPATYSPQYPMGTNLNFLGPKAPRFQQSFEQHPGPADHWIRRDFEPPIPPDFSCLATLPKPSFFGVNAIRFKPQQEEGPGPATYSPNFKLGQFMHCPTAGFSSSAERFKNDPPEEYIEDETENEEKKETLICPKPTWEFKSKVIRMKPLVVLQNEPSPADLPQPNIKVGRSIKLQFTAPFNSSDGRFIPWNDWMPVLGKFKTPGPAYYNLEKPRCNPAVVRGPLLRAQRFPKDSSQSPGPGEYTVGGGVESVLATHNIKLKDNIENQHKFHWEPPVESKKFTFQEQEELLLNKCINICEVDDVPNTKSPKVPVEKPAKETNKPKLLRYFLHRHPIKPGF